MDMITTALAVVGALWLAKTAVGVLLSGAMSVAGGGKRDPAKLGKWAVVTGATDGIGKALCFEFAKRGMNVLLLSRTESKLQACCDEIEQKYGGVDARSLAVDFSKFDAAAQARVAAELKKLDGGVGVLVNNVGMSYPFPLYFHELSAEELDGLLELNVNATTYMTRLALPVMLEQRKGAILNIGSAAGLHPSPLLAVYSATKAYVETLSHSLNTEYASKGVTVQCHVPLFIVSKLSKFKAASWFIPSAETYAKEAVASIGHAPVVSPHVPHAVASWVMDSLPEALVQTGSLKYHLGIRAKGLRKRERDAAGAGDAKKTK